MITNIATDICSNVKSLQDDVNDLEKQMHKQEQIHYAYVESNETTVSEIEQQLITIEESIKKAEESIQRNSICINILIVGLFCAGISILALIYHVVTM